MSPGSCAWGGVCYRSEREAQVAVKWFTASHTGPRLSEPMLRSLHYATDDPTQLTEGMSLVVLKCGQCPDWHVRIKFDAEVHKAMTDKTLLAAPNADGKPSWLAEAIKVARRLVGAT